jgi:predicted dithiol-disulfide oxidoreductase (DUF899 family)
MDFLRNLLPANIERYLRGIDFNLLDLTPLGRQEEWEDSPDGWPQTTPYAWWRLHDEYDDSTGEEG